MKNFATARTWVLIGALVCIAFGLWLALRKDSVVSGVLSPIASTTPPTGAPTPTAKPTTKPTSGIQKPATATQKQYYNEKLRFGFSYPANITISQELAPTYTAGNTETLKLGVYAIQGTNHILYGYIAVNQLIADTTSPAQQKISTSKTTVAGAVSSQRHITDAQSGFTKIDELFTAGGNSYELQFEYSNAQTQAVANTIIKSFYTR